MPQRARLTSTKTDGREARSRRTKAKIRKAAGELIIRKGIDETTVDEIAAAAGIAKGTFYLHFKTKEDLIIEYAQRRLEHVRAALPEILLQASTLEALRQVVDVVVKNRDWHPAIVRIVVLKIAEHFDRFQAIDIRSTLLPVIELGVARGELRSDIGVPVLASFVADAIYAGMRNWGVGLTVDDLDQAIDDAVTLAYDAVRRQDRPRRPAHAVHPALGTEP